MAEEFIGPVIVKGTPREVYSAGVGVVARYDCDIGNGGGVNWQVESKQNGEGEESYPMIIYLWVSTPWLIVEPRRFVGES